MIKFLNTFFVLLLCCALRAQSPVEKESSDLSSNSKLAYAARTYQLGMGEEHSYFSLTNQLSPKLQTELRGFYDTYRSGNVFDISYRAKWYVGKKLYFFGGAGLQMERVLNGGPIFTPKISSGIGYDINKNIGIEAVYDYNFNSVSPAFNASPSGLKLSGKYRF